MSTIPSSLAAADPGLIGPQHLPPADPQRGRGPGVTAVGSGSTFLARHPVAWFLILALGIGWLSLGTGVLLDLPLEPFLLVANFGGLLGMAVFVTARVEGRRGLRRLFAGTVKWRVGWPIAVSSVAGLPVTTMVVAVATGTAQHPNGGWWSMGVSYLAGALFMGALVFNLWEETAWAGFVQSRLAARHGLLAGSALTAIPFAGIHLPLAFADGVSGGRAALGIGVLLVVAVLFRTLAGLLMQATGGSTLAVAAMHASFNAAGALAAVDGQWQGITALALLTTAAFLLRRRLQRSLTAGAVRVG